MKQKWENGAKLILFPEALIPSYPDWVWVLKNSQGADLNVLYVELLNNAVSVPDVEGHYSRPDVYQLTIS